MRLDKGSEFCNRSLKLCLEKSDIEMYSAHSSVVAERFIRTLKNKTDEYMISIPKNISTDKLDNVIDKYNDTYHRTVAMKSADVESNSYTDFKKENNKEGSKFKVNGHARISKYKNTLCRGHMLLVILRVKKLLERFKKKNCKKQIKKSLRFKK